MSLPRISLQVAKSTTRGLNRVAVRQAHNYTYYPTATAAHAPVKEDPQIGDYPNLPLENMQTRDPYAKWDFPQDRRNFGETLHEEDEVLSVWGMDLYTEKISDCLKDMGFAAATFLTIAGVVYSLRSEREFTKREYPYGGLVQELGSIAENKANTGELD
ncbi:MAG: hypothetical protein DHS80DRAFT_25240 [Piptocephalis tieghemiana]|nr:MAG: hypothetical protein DHS80DRAFT_25240 [Piptocephalis tieghemiana]